MSFTAQKHTERNRHKDRNSILLKCRGCLLFIIFLVAFFSCDNLLKICYLFQAMLSFMPCTPSYAIFYAIYPKLCYILCHIPQTMLFFMPYTPQQRYFFLKVMLQYITLTPSYANLSYAMFSGQSRGRISGYCCTKIMNNLLEQFMLFFRVIFQS